MRRTALVTIAGIGLVVLAPATSAGAAVATQTAAQVAVQQQCCVPIWLPYGWFPTKAKCEAEGRRLKQESIGVVSWQCKPQSGGGWKLYLLESA